MSGDLQYTATLSDRDFRRGLDRMEQEGDRHARRQEQFGGRIGAAYSRAGDSLRDFRAGMRTLVMPVGIAMGFMRVASAINEAYVKANEFRAAMQDIGTESMRSTVEASRERGSDVEERIRRLREESRKTREEIDKRARDEAKRVGSGSWLDARTIMSGGLTAEEVRQRAEEAQNRVIAATDLAEKRLREQDARAQREKAAEELRQAVETKRAEEAQQEEAARKAEEAASHRRERFGFEVRSLEVENMRLAGMKDEAELAALNLEYDRRAYELGRDELLTMEERAQMLERLAELRAEAIRNRQTEAAPPEEVAEERFQRERARTVDAGLIGGAAISRLVLGGTGSDVPKQQLAAAKDTNRILKEIKDKVGVAAFA